VLAIGSIWLSFENGGYGSTAGGQAGIAVWWLILLAVGTGLWRLAQLPRSVLLISVLLGLLAVVSLASAAWSKTGDAPLREFDRVSLYLGVLLVSACVAKRGTPQLFVGALAGAISVVSVFALVSRLFPNAFSDRGLQLALPGAAARLSFPIGYWNGLGILLALVVPLLISVATSPRRPLVSALALLPLPVIAVDMYLTSSRGGIGSLLIALAVYLVLIPRRLASVVVLALAGIASVLAVSVLRSRSELINGPFNTPQAAHDGRVASFLIVGIALGLWLVVGVLGNYAQRDWVRGRVVGKVLVGALFTAGAVVTLAAHPISLFNRFRAFPGTDNGGGQIGAHLASGNGSGRWQLWQSAVSEWRTAPFAGRGVGSFESWWAQHSPFSMFVRDAHSLYLQTLAELGLVGFVPLVLALVTAIVAGAMLVIRAEAAERTEMGALLATFVAFCAGAAVDWVWQLAVIPVVAFAALGVLLGMGPRSYAAVRPARVPGPRRAPRFAVLAVGLLAGWFIVCAQAMPLMADSQIARSADAVSRGDSVAALRYARYAQAIDPWSTQPLLERALVFEGSRQLASAKAAIQAAIRRDPADWRLWLVAARVATERGEAVQGAQYLLHAAELNPKSSLFAPLLAQGR
jgi:O-antigen ligase